MNNKGFTLVELLATVVIMGIILSIASTSVLSAIEKSKIKSEAIFVSQIDKAIETYIELNNGSLNECTTEYCEDKKKYREPYIDVGFKIYTFTLKDLASSNYNIFDGSKFYNPRTKEKCDDLGNVTVYIYKDKLHVYNYEADLTNFCNIKEENAQISTFE